MNTHNTTHNIQPLKPTICPEKSDKYGYIDGLAKHEHADPDELIRLAYLRFFEPVLTLPKQKNDYIFRNDITGNAFDTWDYHRMYPNLRELAYRQNRLNWLESKLNDRLIMLSIIKKRIDKKQRIKAVTYARSHLDLDKITDPDTKAFARQYRRSLKLKERIQELKNSCS